VPAVEPHDVPVFARLERLGAVGRRRGRPELARLRNRPARELRAADACREAQVVLDAARDAGLAADRRALDDQHLEALRRTVDGGAKPGGSAADDEQVDLLARREFEADAERPRDLAHARSLQARAAGQHDERQPVGVHVLHQRGRLAGVGAVGVAPHVRQARPSRPLDRPPRRLRRARPDDLDADAVALLQDLATPDEGRQDHVAQRRVLEQQRSQRPALDGDVAQRLRRDRGQVDRLTRQEVQLAEEPGRPVAHDLVPVRGEGRGLALHDRDERVPRIADLEKHIADLGAPLLAMLAEHLQLLGGEDRSDALSHSREDGTAECSRVAPSKVGAGWPCMSARPPLGERHEPLRGDLRLEPGRARCRDRGVGARRRCRAG